MTHALRVALLSSAIALAASGCGNDADDESAPAPAAAEAPAAGGAVLPPPVDDTAGPVDALPPTTPGPTVDLPPAPPPPAMAVPAPFQGTFAADASACADPAHESQLAIGNERITFHESTGPILQAAMAGDALSLTAELTGEGETREATYRFALSEDGNTLTDLDGGMARVRCGG